MDSPTNADQLERGEILVTRQTDSEWTLLFPRAAAILSDVGASLSHTAIVARELGIPAVVGTGDATMTLATGDRVAIDGGQGVVRNLNNSRTGIWIHDRVRSMLGSHRPSGPNP